MSQELEQLERQKREAAQRKADRQTQDAAADRRRRRLIRIEIAAFILSAVGVAFVLYYDTTQIADDFLAVHMRWGKVLDVHDGGRLYRIPILDKVALVDKGNRPMPALRRTVKSANGAAVAYEALIFYSVSDAEKYWNRFKGADTEAARLVSQAVEAASQRAIARLDDKQVTAGDAAKTLSATALADANRVLAETGMHLRELRFVSLRLMQ
jgi:hypothetical protein